MRRTRLSGDVAELVSRRVIALALITWLPLLVLSIAEGRAWGESVKVPFLLDVDVHARFLLALPLLIFAELVVHQRMRPVVGAFVTRGLVPEKARWRFDAAICLGDAPAQFRAGGGAPDRVRLWRRSLVIWRSYSAIEVPTWYGRTLGGSCTRRWPAGGSAA
jgi:hypothetical protein